ncbi:putative ArsR family transcriptional regulator [Saccharothrix tamanrassetensis]|uniref:Putative ArsR family transcriptional regulator n=1 Tax=Saccharothrix tamanrassetensis TaxID=1051531 RepID=A0A841CQE0_9PSEU|nr:helix-turn-helix domain-containing protein [Saccharothrix tamanrassetensis]MBB5958574.1 putative ArsR family transcriptional regulator [Saccharothrix tamanrassetensis]
MGDASQPRAHISAVAALDEPTRRRLYDFVVRHEAPVSRDEAAEAVGVPRTTAAFHLDRLVSEGLLEVVHERRTGRTGPGAGRPSKLYRRSAEQIAVSLPDRRYELVGLLLADALSEVETSGEPPRTVLHRRARVVGRDLGEKARAAAPTAQGSRQGVIEALEGFGFEPRAAEPDTSIVLGNCPFHELARQHTELVCGMNLCLLDGLLDGLAATGLTARLAPAAGQCCVRLDPAEHAAR